MGALSDTGELEYLDSSAGIETLRGTAGLYGNLSRLVRAIDVDLSRYRPSLTNRCQMLVMLHVRWHDIL